MQKERESNKMTDPWSNKQQIGAVGRGSWVPFLAHASTVTSHCVIVGHDILLSHPSELTFLTLPHQMLCYLSSWKIQSFSVLKQVVHMCTSADLDGLNKIKFRARYSTTNFVVQNINTSYYPSGANGAHTGAQGGAKWQACRAAAFIGFLFILLQAVTTPSQCASRL
jgi:hypothetical protein